MNQWKWTPAASLCIEGRGWEDTKELFHRLPAKAEGVVRDEIWDLSQKTTGITIRFETNSTQLRARWLLGEATLSIYHTPAYAHSGLDLYARASSGRWLWAGWSNEMEGADAAMESGLNSWGALDGDFHEYQVYLPLYNSVKSLEIGILPEAAIRSVPARGEKPIAYYGTSIVHGAGVSRAGMTHVSILGRRLDYPVLNLGFSGNAIMEPEVADLLAELDPVLYVVDALPNMAAERILEFAEPFIRRIRTGRPDTPIVLVEDRTYPAGWLCPEIRRENTTRREACKTVYGRLLSKQVSGLYYIEGDGLLGMDNDGTSDGSHCNDLGASRMAAGLEPVLRRILCGFDACLPAK